MAPAAPATTNYAPEPTHGQLMGTLQAPVHNQQCCGANLHESMRGITERLDTHGKRMRRYNHVLQLLDQSVTTIQAGNVTMSPDPAAANAFAALQARLDAQELRQRQR